MVKVKKKTPKKTLKKKTRKKSTKKPIEKRSITFLKFCLVSFIWGILALIALIFINSYNLPNITEAMKFDKRPSVTILAEDQTILARYGETQGRYLYADEIPNHLKQAILAIEDRRFYSHFGLDPIALVRAMYTNIKKGHFAQGGSTLTQQLAKILFLTPEKTLSRKFQEALTAFWLEYNYTKDEILSAYINRVYLGAGTYGFDAAAQRYFGRSATMINESEAAMLAGLLKAPSRYAPHSNPQTAKKRMKTVLNSMKEAGFITSIENLPAPRLVSSKKNPSNLYFTNYIFEQIKSYVGNSQKDLIIYTTLMPDLQNKASRIISDFIANTDKTRNISQAASLITSTDGAIRSMVGGVDFKKSQFNRTLHARRQIGSSFKPIIYLNALEQLKVKPQTILTDKRRDYNGYSPRNYNERYYGDITLKEAFAKSSNTIAVELLNQTGVKSAIKTARKLGITGALSSNLDLALGSSALTMAEMVGAFATINNKGYPVTPYGIKRIQHLDGEVLFQHETYQDNALFKQKDLETLKTMMRATVKEGTGHNANHPYIEFYGKTGTSENYRDAWFIGFSDHFVGAVWLGNDDNSKMNKITGGGFPTRLWQDIMVEAHQNASQDLRKKKPDTPKFIDKILSIFK